MKKKPIINCIFANALLAENQRTKRTHFAF